MGNTRQLPKEQIQTYQRGLVRTWTGTRIMPVGMTMAFRIPRCSQRPLRSSPQPKPTKEGIPPTISARFRLSRPMTPLC